MNIDRPTNYGKHIIIQQMNGKCATDLNMTTACNMIPLGSIQKNSNHSQFTTDNSASA